MNPGTPIKIIYYDNVVYGPYSKLVTDKLRDRLKHSHDIQVIQSSDSTDPSEMKIRRSLVNLIVKMLWICSAGPNCESTSVLYDTRNGMVFVHTPHVTHKVSLSDPNLSDIICNMIIEDL